MLATLRRSLAAAVALGAGIALAGPALAEQPIKIGAFLTVTGPASFLGDPEAKVLKLYTERLNKEGGLLGRKVEAVIYDTGGDAKKAVSFARRLIEEDKVDVLIGGATTGDTMAVVPLATDAGIPQISLGGASVIVHPVKKWVFKMPQTDRQGIEVIYTDMKKRHLTTIGMIEGSGAFDQSCRKQAHEAAAEMGIKIAIDETYGRGDSDMTPQLTKIKNTPGVQAVMTCGFGEPTVILVRNYKQLGMSNIPFYHNHSGPSQAFLDGAAGAAEGIRMPAVAVIVANALPDSNPQKKVSLDFIKTYKAAYNEQPSIFAALAYDAFEIATQAIKRAGSTDKAKVRDEIEKTKHYVGLDGIYTMSPTDHMGLGLDSLIMTEIKNNTWAIVK
jgi:branched-chain amino acid transport system substrate-binding protein